MEPGMQRKPNREVEGDAMAGNAGQARSHRTIIIASAPDQGAEAA
jgi:hypothetical protein